MSDLVEHLRDCATAAWMEIEATAQASGWSGAMSRAADEITRLQEAKTAALKVADERSKENCAFRQENERLTAALRTIADHSGICSDFPHSAENLQRYARHALEQTGNGK